MKQSKCSHAPWIRPIQFVADLWRNLHGEIVIRFSSHNGYIFHFVATLSDGKRIPEKYIEDFSDFIAEVLMDWEGTNDAPDPNFSSANA